ncbi:MAG: tRNA 2-thiouridine(34) synthase MnmA [Clostridiales bacterium]
MKNKEKVLIGLSGGVDSSVAAYILKESGYEVIGVTMNLFQNYSTQNSNAMIRDAKNVAEKLGIEFIEFDLNESFKSKVIDYFKKEYLKGRTPNPCVVCNKFIKFGDLLEKADRMNIKYISTGHYAKIQMNERGFYNLKKPKDKTKDQTYFLYGLKQNQLSRVIMPLGNYDKKEVREIAKQADLFVANKKDSQEICFIEDNDYVKFIIENSSTKIIQGDFVDLQGNVLGIHKGIIYYTIGQRKGLGITFGKPKYVIEIDYINNRIVLGDNEDLFQHYLIAENINLITDNKIIDNRNVEIKIRNSSKLSKAKLTLIENNKAKIIFEVPQRAITPGQSAVFYDDDMLLGGGVITKVNTH